MWHQCNLAAKESGLECTYVNNDGFTVVVSGDGRHHWVRMCTLQPSHSKWLGKQSNESASNFALSLNIPPWKLFRLSEGCSYGQLVIGSFITTMCQLMSCAKFLAKHQITQVTQSPYSPDLVPWNFWLFKN